MTKAMAGAACKTIINQLIQALTRALETILVNPTIHRNLVPEEARLRLLQQLADLDLAAYSGDAGLTPSGGLAGIVAELGKHGLVTDEVWRILKKPE